jgi:hypothetical protein
MVGKFNEQRVAFYTAQLALAAKFLEDAGQVQWILCPESIYVTREGNKRSTMNVLLYVDHHIKIITPFRIWTEHDGTNVYYGICTRIMVINIISARSFFSRSHWIAPAVVVFWMPDL